MADDCRNLFDWRIHFDTNIEVGRKEVDSQFVVAADRLVEYRLVEYRLVEDRPVAAGPFAVERQES